jgi:hypothetical protein
MKLRVLILIIFLCLPSLLFAQETAIIFGIIKGSDGSPIFLANVSIPGTRYGVVTKADGSYELSVPAGKEITIVFSCVGYEQADSILTLQPGSRLEINQVMQVSVTNLDEVSVSEEIDRSTTITRINIKTLNQLPTTSGSVEAMIKTLPGVSSTNELSSQYSVRGGNFDENLVYVNDIEIYRPFLIRSGQQEGMSFINSDMVSSIRFSSGGFEASYGDKMSSVLDITYRRPTEFGGSANVSLLGGALHLEGASKNQRFTHTSGVRYKTSQYLLQSLETKGEYIPNFFDFQTFITYNLTETFEISVLGNIATNCYKFIPANRTTKFGTVDVPLNLIIFYDGQETDKFNTYFGAFTAHYRPNTNLSLKFISSAYNSIEKETYDIQGQYLINQLDNRIGSESFGDSILNIGIGTFLSHARNYLDAYVYSLSHTGSYNADGHRIKWGLKWQQEAINDNLSEWEMVDSAGYSIPFSDKEVKLSDVIKSENNLLSNRYSSYLQHTYAFYSRNIKYYLNSGIRLSYWDYNNQMLVSPRITFSMKPDWNRNMMFRLATGYYYQPPFYKELRFPAGDINPEIRAQKSVHIVAGGDYIFSAWNRPFKFTVEFYYKHLADLIPYKLDNVRIRYAAENKASGYAAGIDLKIHGDFVPGAESWASLSLMKTQEDISNDFFYNKIGQKKTIGPYPRPTDQRLNFGLFFQDYFPNHPDYKVSLNILFGTGLPFSAPGMERYDRVFRMPSYKRVDIGFSRAIIKEGMPSGEGKSNRFFRNLWVSAEVFNLLGIKNTISYLWVKTVSNQDSFAGEFAVPNYLTSRRFNIKVSAKF